jgi:uncharacterized membrane protein YeaQ/YmgE (transglycosylase-associated protein family)
MPAGSAAVWSKIIETSGRDYRAIVKIVLISYLIAIKVFAEKTRLGDLRMYLAPESIVAWLIIGALAGWLAGRIVHGYGLGLFGNIVIGILGAVIGGSILPRLGFIPASAGGDFVAATLGAVILLVLIGLVRRR